MSHPHPQRPFDQGNRFVGTVVPMPGPVRTIGAALDLAFERPAPIPDDFTALLNAIDIADPTGN